MCRVWVNVLVLSLAMLFGSGQSLAQSRGKAEVFVGPAGDDLIVTIALDRKTDRLVLDRADVVRSDSIKLETPGLTFADDTISGEKPFDRVTFRLAEDVTERDAQYPPFYRVGPGRMLYAPTIYPDPEHWTVSLSPVGFSQDWISWPTKTEPTGYLYLGPRSSLVEEAGVRFVFDGTGDAVFEARIRETVLRSLGYLQEVFGSPPAASPFVATSILPADQRFSIGDVTSSAMIALRFFGKAPDPTAPDALASTRSIILHEGVHFWNGGVAHFAQGSPQWMHEGGAEYLATLGSYQLGWTDRTELAAKLGSWFDRCSTSLSYSDEVALNDLKSLNSSLRYSCGPLLHTLIELYQAERSNAPIVAEGWRNLVRTAAADDGTYDLDDFVEAFGGSELLDRPALKAILATGGQERWQIVLDEMQRMGVKIDLETSPPLRARTALMHLIRSQCTQLGEGQGYGFYSGQASYRLDTPEGCGVLSGGPTIETLAGFPVTQLSAENYVSLQALCEGGEVVTFGAADGKTIPVPCTAPLGDAATKPSVSALPDIAAFSRPDEKKGAP